MRSIHDFQPPILRHFIFVSDAISMTESGRQRFCEDVTNRNLTNVPAESHSYKASRSIDVLDTLLPGYPRVVGEKSRYSEDIADRNLSMSSASNQPNISNDAGRSTSAVTRKPVPTQSYVDDEFGNVSRPEYIRDIGSSHTAVWTLNGADKAEPKTHTRQLHQHRNGRAVIADVKSNGNIEHMAGNTDHPLRRKRSSTFLHSDEALAKGDSAKNLASAVSSLRLNDEEHDLGSTISIPAQKAAPPIPARAARRSSPDTQAHVNKYFPAQQLDAEGIDLTNSVDTEVRERYAPAVVHEVVKPTVHHIRDERVTREIHNHSVFHRILPVRDVEILPARHFMKDANGDMREVSAATVPRLKSSDRTWQIVQNVGKKEEIPLTPRTFTASTLDGFAQDYEERVDADGVKRSHTTWIHPPVLQDGGRQTGQTRAFHIDPF